MILRLLTAGLAAAVFLSASLPCGLTPSAGKAIEVAAAENVQALHAHAEPARDADEAGSTEADMPCHASAAELPPPPELTLPCTCGCDQRAAGGGAGLSRLPLAVLLPELEAAPRSRAPVPPLPSFEGAPGYPASPDVVPWA